MTKSLLLRPRMSEKGYALSKASATYVFDVPKTANRLIVKDAVVAQFKVQVKAVKLANVKGKRKRTFYKNGAKSVYGQKPMRKRAYVTLKSGQHIPIYDALDKAEAKAAKAEAKAAAKEAK